VSSIPKLSDRKSSRITARTAIANIRQLVGLVSGRSLVRVQARQCDRWQPHLSSPGSSVPGFRLQAEPQIVGPVARRSLVPRPGQCRRVHPPATYMKKRGPLRLGSSMLDSHRAGPTCHSRGRPLPNHRPPVGSCPLRFIRFFNSRHLSMGISATTGLGIAHGNVSFR